MDDSRRLTAAVFLTAFSVLLLELTLTRIFSVLMWYHFASLSIAVALFGFAVGGVVVHLKPSVIPEMGFPRSLGPYILLASAGAMIPFLLLWMTRIRPDLLFPLLSFYHQPYFQPFRHTPPGPDAAVILSLSVLFFAITVPFAAAGVVFAGAFMRAPKRILGLLYGADLAGAAAGCLLFVPALEILGAPSLLALTAGLGAGAAGLLLRGMKARVVFVFAVIGIIIAGYNGPADRLVKLQFARGQYEPGLLYYRWNALSRVVVYPLSRAEAEQSWGISRQFRGVFPDNLGMLVDDAGYTPIIENRNRDTTPGWAPYHIISLAYLLRPDSSSLIIGPGGGRDILAALGSGAREVTAVELNPLIVDSVQRGFEDFSGGPYTLPGVQLVIGEGRSRLARTGKTFDIIQASSVFGEISPSAGAFSLSANFLYTREAFSEYWEHLSDDGILSFSRTVFGLRALRLVSLARDLLLAKGVEDPENSIAVLRERGLATVLVARNGFSASDIESLNTLAQNRSFTIEHLPGKDTQGRFTRAALGEDVTGGKFDIAPPTDNRPFFYNNVPRGRFFSVFFSTKAPGERHILVLRTMWVIFLVMVLLLLSLPLVTRARKGRTDAGQSARIGAYFAGIGMGYMVVELTMMHRLSLFLGNPTYSLTVVLFIVLLSSSLGSIYAGSRNKPVLTAGWAMPVALILLIFGIWFIAGLLTPSLALGQGGRIVLVALLLSPPGFFMGWFMPMGLAALSARDPEMIPWAWAVNGATSVLGSLGVLIVAMNFGYFAALSLGALSYALTVPFLSRMAGERNDARKEVFS
ncbi:hypothetical protein EP232_00835 [bacterium]|nr:MAG: hypothetical protein EP232_00835 [bacterium]